MLVGSQQACPGRRPDRLFVHFPSLSPVSSPHFGKPVIGCSLLSSSLLSFFSCFFSFLLLLKSTPQAGSSTARRRRKPAAGAGAQGRSPCLEAVGTVNTVKPRNNGRNNRQPEVLEFFSHNIQKGDLHQGEIEISETQWIPSSHSAK